MGEIIGKIKDKRQKIKDTGKKTPEL